MQCAVARPLAAVTSLHQRIALLKGMIAEKESSVAGRDRGAVADCLHTFDDVADLLSMLRDPPERDDVVWVTLRRETVAVHRAPLDVRPVVRTWFQKQKGTVLTSATLSVDGSLEATRAQLGIEEAEEVVLPSPFPYEHAALLYVARDVPHPGNPAWSHAVADVVAAVSKTLKGLTLVLFTSYNETAKPLFELQNR